MAEILRSNPHLGCYASWIGFHRILNLKKASKTYPLNQSSLFRLYSLKRLSVCLGITRTQLKTLADCDDNYFEFYKTVNGKTRHIQTPKPLLKIVHARVFELLRRIETPNYLHSGIKKRSYITNAAAHRPELAGFKLDIKNFYPSTSSDHVYRTFREKFECSDVVARYISKLLTTKGHLPTGSTVSQCLAFWVHVNMFERISRLCNNLGGTMTVYVDDIFVSVGVVKKSNLLRVGRIINQQGLDWHKERVYRAHTPKHITGVIRHIDGTKLPNSKHLKLKRSFSLLSASNSHEDKLSISRSISGQLSTASQLDSELRGRSVAAIGYQKHVERS